MSDQEIKKISISPREIGEYLLRKEKISTGCWIVGLDVGVQGINAKAVEQDEESPIRRVRPAVLTIVEGFYLREVTDESPEQRDALGDLLIDAATL